MKQPRYAVGDKVRVVSMEVMDSFRKTDGHYITPEGLYINETMFSMADRVVTIRRVEANRCRYRLSECDWNWDEYLLTDLEEEDPEASERLCSALIALLCPKEGCS